MRPRVHRLPPDAPPSKSVNALSNPERGNPERDNPERDNPERDNPAGCRTAHVAAALASYR